MNPFKIISFYLIFFLFPGSFVAQSNIIIDHYTKNYGLDYHWIYDITQDENGFLWFASHTGLERYDGYDYLKFRHSDIDSNSLSINTQIAVSTDIDGNIWSFGTDHVFNIYDPSKNQFKHISKFVYQGNEIDIKQWELKFFTTLNDGQTYSLFQGTNNQSFSGHGSFWKYNSAENNFELIFEFVDPDDDLSYFTRGKSGKFWFWGRKKGFYKLDTLQENLSIPINLENQFPGNDQYQFPIDQEGKFWYPGNDDPDQISIPEYLPKGPFKRIEYDNQGGIWIYHSEKSVIHFDPKQKKFQQFEDPLFDMTSNKALMFHFFVDKDGYYWNGHFTGGVHFRERQQSFNRYSIINEDNSPNKSGQASIRQIISLNEQKIILLNDRNEIYLLDVNINQSELIYETLSESEYEVVQDQIYSMTLSKDGTIWINKNRSIVNINPLTKKSEDFPLDQEFSVDEFINDPLKRHWPIIFEDINRTLWWCEDERIYIFDKNQKKLVPSALMGDFQSNGVNFKFGHFNPSENVFYATYAQGILMLNCNSNDITSLEIFEPEEAYDILITDIYKREGEYWLASNKGLFRVDSNSGTKKLYNRRSGLPTNLVYSITADDRYLWLGTQSGICQFDPTTERISVYNSDWGLSLEEFNAKSVLNHSSGNLFFGSKKGLISFNPQSINMPNQDGGQLRNVEFIKRNQKSG